MSETKTAQRTRVKHGVRRAWTVILIALAAALLLIFSISRLQGTAERPESLPNDLPGVWLEIPEGSISPTGLEVRYLNEAGRSDLTCGAWFRVEEQRAGEWTALPTLSGEEPAFPLWGRLLVPDQSPASAAQNRETFDWTGIYGPLPPGEYRVVTRLTTGQGETLKEFLLAAEFALAEE